MKLYKYYIKSIKSPEDYTIHTSCIETDEGDVRKVPMPKSVCRIFKQQQYPPNATNSDFIYYAGTLASMEDVKQELSLLKTIYNSKYDKYIEHLKCIKKKYRKDVDIIYKTPNGVLELATKGRPLIIPTTSNEDELSTNGKQEPNLNEDFYDKPYIDLE